MERIHWLACILRLLLEAMRHRSGEARHIVKALQNGMTETNQTKQRVSDLSRQRNEAPLTTVQITLPDELAQKAASAGLLSAEAMEAMWQRGPQEELTPEIEQEIVEEVRKVRAERRPRGAS
jgi:hypothetical protein